MPPAPNGDAARAFRAAHDAMLPLWPVVPEDVWLTTATGRTHLLAAGPKDAPAVFLVPGIATPGVMWAEQIQALAGAHRVYAVDLPGNAGLSEPVRRPRSFADFARWWVEVLDALGLDRAGYVGMSYGGAVGAQITLAVPERVRRLALLAPAATLHPLTGAFMMRTLPQLVWPTRAVFASFMRWMAVAPSADAGGRDRYETLVEGAIDLFYTGRKRDGVLLLPTPKVLSDEEMRRMSVPTLVLIGDQEKIYPAGAALSRARALMPRVRTVSITDASHDLMFAQPGQVNAALGGFFAEA